MKRYAIVVVAILVALGGGGCGDSREGEAAAPRTSAAPAADVVRVHVGDATARADVADDDAERARGLGGRARLGRDAGMYFVMPGDSPSFWMKGMRFPLDMIWIRDGRVVDVTARIPPPARAPPKRGFPPTHRTGRRTGCSRSAPGGRLATASARVTA